MHVKVWSNKYLESQGKSAKCYDGLALSNIRNKDQLLHRIESGNAYYYLWVERMWQFGFRFKYFFQGEVRNLGLKCFFFNFDDCNNALWREKSY